MRRDFDDEQEDPRQRDTVLTLGPLMLTGMALVLACLCGGCFILGYRFGGHETRVPTAATQTADAGADPAESTPATKPSAVATPQRRQGAATPTPEATDGASAEKPVVSPAAATPSTAAPAATTVEAPVVHPALPVETTPAPAALMQGPVVQVATISQMEDAQVLVGALKKRGYPASVHRDASDGLLHVQVGPFATRADAAATRQKLLNDGYNAVLLQP